MDRIGYLLVISCSLLMLPVLPTSIVSLGNAPVPAISRADVDKALYEGAVLYVHDQVQTLNSTYSIRVPEGSVVTDIDLSISPRSSPDDQDMYPSEMWFRIGRAGNSYSFPMTANTGDVLGQWGHQTYEVSGDTFKEFLLTGTGNRRIDIAIPENASITSFEMDVRGEQRGDEYIEAEILGDEMGDSTGWSMVNAGKAVSTTADALIVSAPFYDNGFGKLFKFYYSGGYYYNDTMAMGPAQGERYGTSLSDPFKVTASLEFIAVGAPMGGKTQEGAVYLYDVRSYYSNDYEDMLLGNDSIDGFGTSVTVGDVDGDGWKEMVVGAPGSDSGKGSVYLLEYDTSSPDFSDLTSLKAVIPNPSGGTGFGRIVSCGDFDGDGLDDISVASDSEVFLFLGSETFDTGADLEFDPIGDKSLDGFSFMRMIGDSDGDGTDTLAIGAPSDSDRVVILYEGGSSPDVVPDLTIPNLSRKNFGTFVSDLHDTDGDGVPDLAIGSPDPGTGSRIDIYDTTGAPLDWFGDSRTGSMYGSAIVMGVDLRGDGFPDITVSSPFKDGTTNYDRGRVLVQEYYDISTLPVNRPSLKIGNAFVWNCTVDRLSGTISTGDISQKVMAAFAGIPLNETIITNFDRFKVLTMTMTSPTASNMEGSLGFNITSFSIKYDLDHELEGLIEKINADLGDTEPIDGFHNIPVRFLSLSPGGLAIERFGISFDLPPVMSGYPRLIEVPEDTYEPRALDILSYVSDDASAHEDIIIEVDQLQNNASFVRLSLGEGRYLVVDAFNDTSPSTKNDNWTGEVYPIIRIRDSRGLITIVEDIVVRISPVNDPPALIKLPETSVKEDTRWSFTPELVDAESDESSFSISSIPGMTVVNNRTIIWDTNNSHVGENVLELIASDGKDARTYVFHITVTNENDYPYFISVPPGNVDIYLGDTYTFQFIAMDIDVGDVITYTLMEGEGARIDGSTGNFTYTPALLHVNGVKFTVNIMDRKRAEVSYSFFIRTVPRLAPPEVISEPRTDLSDLIPWTYTIDVYEPNGDVPEITFVSGPEGMVLDPIRNQLRWSPGIDQIGDHQVSIRVNSSGFSVYQNFTLAVARSEREWNLQYTSPEPEEKLTGTVKITGTVTLYPGKVESIQMRIDEGEWINISFLEDAFSYDLETGRFGDGDHTISVRAYDGYSFSPERTVKITIANHEGDVPWFVYLLIAVVAVLILAGVGYLGLIVFRANRKRQQEKEKEQKMKEIQKSKDDMDRFLSDNIAPGKDQEGPMDLPEVEAMDLDDLVHKTDTVEADGEAIPTMGISAGVYDLDDGLVEFSDDEEDLDDIFGKSEPGQ